MSVDFSCISWNIHRARGNDGRVDPGRIVDVLAAEVWRPGYDALILQEADAEARPHAGLLDITALEAATGLRHAHRLPDHRWSPESHGFLGNVLFLRPDIAVTSLTLLDLPGHCPRGAIVAKLTRGGQDFRLIAVHLALSQLLRLVQLRTISQHLARDTALPTLLVGDLNEWRWWGGLALSPRLLGLQLRGPTKATFPVRWPILPLDRALACPPAQVTQTDVLDGPGIRIASDHRPLAAHVRFTP